MLEHALKIEFVLYWRIVQNAINNVKKITFCADSLFGNNKLLNKHKH